MIEPNISDSSKAEAKIEISLSRLGQLFNSLDPSPFHERDLDQDAEEYIIGSAEEIPRQDPLRLVIYLPADQLPKTGAVPRFRFVTYVVQFFGAGRGPLPPGLVVLRNSTSSLRDLARIGLRLLPGRP